MRSPFEVHRREIVERGVAAVRIVPRLDEIEDGGFGLLQRSEAVFHEQLAFERRIEALAHCIIVTVTA